MSVPEASKTVKKRSRQAETASATSCACGVEPAARDERKAVGVDPAIKKATTARLRRIEGQVRGLQRMVDEERYCADVLVQISSVQEALRGVARELLKNHLKHCAADAIRRGPDEAEAMYAELVDLFHRHQR